MEAAGLTITIDRRTDPGRVVASLVGEIDPGTAGTFREDALGAIDGDAPAELVVDLAGVTFMDSSGVRVILELNHRQAGSGGRSTLANVPPLPPGPGARCGPRSRSWVPPVG